MKLDLTGRKTLVIGGARGIGASIVRYCADAGIWSSIFCGKCVFLKCFCKL